ncbi:DUF2236 domain-containing protein [Caerostris extrusa]|uniref:DUF2236 domain-containing protein n=1 Tax=Caerostris extrusa TaxID=172846 RepID=A0AAV4YAN8_CAEEX|nr:DUF2236 domain-containing protein [Caerostris extrusa]
MEFVPCRYKVIETLSCHLHLPIEDLDYTEIQPSGQPSDTMSPNAKPEEPDAVVGKFDELREGAEVKGDCESPADQPPPWLDKERFYRARDIFKNHFFQPLTLNIILMKFVCTLFKCQISLPIHCTSFNEIILPTSPVGAKE